MATKKGFSGDRIIMGLTWLVVLGMIWLIWRPQAPVPESPQLAAYHARQQAACTVAKEAQAKLREKGLEHQAQKLDTDSVCDPGRPLRRTFYWLVGGTAALGLFITLLFSVSPRF